MGLVPLYCVVTPTLYWVNSHPSSPGHWKDPWSLINKICITLSMSTNGHKWAQVDQFDIRRHRWTQEDTSGRKWTQVDTFEYKATLVDTSGHSWMLVDTSQHKLTQVDTGGQNGR
jgi:hypothetical protein